MNQVWHEEHFLCSGPCKKPFTGAEYFEREGKPYCKADFDKLFASKQGEISAKIQYLYRRHSIKINHFSIVEPRICCNHKTLSICLLSTILKEFFFISAAAKPLK